MSKKLAIITTCTNTKTHDHQEVCLDDCHKNTVISSIDCWFKNLLNPTHKRYEAQKLYSGSLWKETLGIKNIAENSGFDVSHWILSAGWGFIPAEYKITPYCATFSSGKHVKNSIHYLQWPDNVTKKERTIEWWKLLHKKRKIEDLCRLAELTKHFPKDDPPTILVVISQDYFPAIEQELLELTGKGLEVIIVSAGLYSNISMVHQSLRDNVLPLNDKFKQIEKYLDHTNTTLNTRLASWILQNHSNEFSKGLFALYEKLAQIEKELPESKRRPINSLEEKEILAWIENNYDPNSPEKRTASPLLTLFRKSGFSCEQKDFGKLFKRFLDEYKEKRQPNVFDFNSSPQDTSE